MTNTFSAARGLSNAHAQTIWPVLMRRPPVLARARERFELPDGDFIDLDWLDENPASALVIVLHGLSGSADSIYVLGIQQALRARGIGSVAMNFRGASGTPNRRARNYHGGDTGDIAALAAALGARFPSRALFAVGYSIGASVLLRWLGETGRQNPLRAACAVSVPFSLAACSAQLDRGFSRIYRNRLRDDLLASLRRKQAALRAGGDPRELAVLDALGSLDGIVTFRDYDNRVMAPLHGFRDADDYYARCSPAQFLTGVAIPTCVMHALDDPFMTPDVIPRAVSACVEMRVSAHGGHVGFVGGGWRQPDYWLETAVPDFLQRHL
jgi:predicted alpha/beta-fold hydrolase